MQKGFDVGVFAGMFNTSGSSFYEYGAEAALNFSRGEVNVSVAGATSPNAHDYTDDITTVAAAGAFNLTENLAVGATIFFIGLFKKTVIADGAPIDVLRSCRARGGLRGAARGPHPWRHARRARPCPVPAIRPEAGVSTASFLAAVDLLEPLSYGFFRRGLTVAVLAGALCGLVLQ